MDDTFKIHKKPIFRPCFMSIASNNGTWILDIGHWIWMRVCVCLLACVRWSTLYNLQSNIGINSFSKLSTIMVIDFMLFSLSLPITIFSVYQNFKMVFVAFLLLPLPPFGIAALYVKRFGYMAEKNIIWRYKDKHKNWMRTSIDKFSHKICQTQTIPYH